MKKNNPKTIFFPFCLLFVLTTPNLTLAQIADANLETLCEKVEDLRILDAIITSASIVQGEEDIPEHCLVVGYTLPANHFEIRIPTKTWNGKFFLAGCGGACGRLPVNITGYSKMAIQRGYAIATMDTGHWGSSLFDFRWGYNNPVAEVDYAYKAVHETARVSKIVIKAFSGQDPTHSYFGGCSNGGRQGLMEAIRYPEDFDGIISEAPGISITDITLLFTWMDKQNTGSDGKDIIGPADIPIIAKAVYDACDTVDGQKDGLISDPRKCQFDPSSLLCTKEGQEDCLNREQVRVLQSWYKGPVNSAGEPVLSSGVALSSEPFWWWFVGQTDRAHDHIFSAPDALRYVYLEEDPGPDYDPYTDFDFDSDPPKLEYMGQLLNADSPQLDQFQESGGKLLMFQGWSDPAIPYESTIQYYDKVEGRFGGKDNTQAFFRLFMIPGMDHCSINTSLGMRAESLDPLTVLENWVEKGEAPETLKVRRYDNDGGVLAEFSVAPFSKDDN